METMVHQNKKIWEETVRYSDNYGKPPKASCIKDIPPIKFDNNDQRVVKVFNESLLKVAEKAVSLGLRPLIINAGSDNDPLKPMYVGAIGTEWDLFRRSNLGSSLIEADLYPLRNNSVLYVSDVTVFRSEEFKILKKPYKISILTIPPLRRPGLVSERLGDSIVDSYQNQSEQDRMNNDIEKIFQIALLKGHRCVIIDDFGCQKNCENPVDKVIAMFNNAVKRYPVKYVFFAISEPLLESMSRDNKKVNSVYKNYKLFDTSIFRGVK